MALLEEGRFKVTVTSAGLKRKGASNLLCLSVYLKAYEGKDGDDYIPVEGDFGIIHDIYLEKKPDNGGGLIEDVIKRLAHVFEWQGDLSALADTVTGANCKVTVGMRTYNGKTTPEVKWINHIDDGDGGGGFNIERDAALDKQAQAQYGPKIRAILGAPAPARPAAYASRPPAAPAVPAAPAKVWDEEGVWNALVSKLRAESVEAAEHEKAWFCLLGEVANAKSGADVKDWGALGEALAEWVYVPF